MTSGRLRLGTEGYSANKKERNLSERSFNVFNVKISFFIRIPKYFLLQ